MFKIITKFNIFIFGLFGLYFWYLGIRFFLISSQNFIHNIFTNHDFTQIIKTISIIDFPITEFHITLLIVGIGLLLIFIGFFYLTIAYFFYTPNNKGNNNLIYEPSYLILSLFIITSSLIIGKIGNIINKFIYLFLVNFQNELTYLLEREIQNIVFIIYGLCFLLLGIFLSIFVMLLLFIKRHQLKSSK